MVDNQMIPKITTNRPIDTIDVNLTISDINYLLNTVYPILKWSLLIFLVLYLIISFVVIKQIKMMTRTLETPTDKYLILLGYIHFGLVAGVICFSLLAL